MAFDREKYLDALAAAPDAALPMTNATWVSIEVATLPCWQCLGAFHLTAEENEGRHHVYVDLVDEEINLLPMPDPEAWLCYAWLGMRQEETPPKSPFEKAAPEPGANVPIYPRQAMRIWIDGHGIEASDTVHNLHTDLPSDGTGNRPGHHSYYVVYKAPGAQG